MIDTYPIKSPFTLIYLFLLLIFFFSTTHFVSPSHLSSPINLLLLSHLLKFLYSPIWNSWLNFLVFYLFSQLSFLTQFVSSLISLTSTQFVSLKKILCSPICSYGFFLDALARTYVIHLLGIYVTILCYWLIFWQNALYLYLGRCKMCLIP